MDDGTFAEPSVSPPWTNTRIDASDITIDPRDAQLRAEVVELVRRHDQSEADVLWIEFIPPTPTFGDVPSPAGLRFGLVQRDDKDRPRLAADRTPVVDQLEVDLRGELPSWWMPSRG